MISKYGSFSENGSEYIINTLNLPRNWYNYFYTDHYISYTSQAGRGCGFLQDTLGRRYSPVCSRGVYIHDGKSGWNLTGLPVYSENQEYYCTHGIGYTVITLKKNGIKTEYGIFVPCTDSATTGYEIVWVKVTNCTDNQKTLKVMAYAENTVDGVYQPQGYNTRSIFKDNSVNGLHANIITDWNNAPQNFEVFLTSGQNISGYDCAKNAFIGPYGTVDDPIVLHQSGCTNSDCIAEKCGFALQTTLKLNAGESGFASFAMGMTESIEHINALTADIATEKQVFALLDDVKKKYAKVLDGISIKTPNENLNRLFNSWLKYQTNMGSRWARVRHNGFRDIASDTECLSCFNPELAWQRIKRLLSYQYENGYSPRTFIDGEIKDRNFSDCTVWLTFTVYAIINELGDINLLNEIVPFNNGATASVYEHLRRSVDWLYNFKGHYGLIKIWGGDWNDCMNKVGINGKGVSIWLTMAWYRANRQFIELAEMLGKTDDATLAKERSEKMRELIDRYGWDSKGNYYIYAISDDGHLIGAPECKEGSIYLNPQLWAVLSGIAYDGKDIIAINNAEKLLNYELGTALSTPAYTQNLSYVGDMTEKSAGVQENGGVYLHPMCWKLAVDALLGRSDSVQYDLDAILPFNNPVVDGRAEPYVICNCYMGKETGYRYGTPGQSWRTASGQWLLYALARFVFGITPTVDGLKVLPCLPQSWESASVVRLFRDCNYNIFYHRTGKKAIFANGKQLPFDSVLPYTKNGNFDITVEF